METPAVAFLTQPPRRKNLMTTRKRAHNSEANVYHDSKRPRFQETDEDLSRPSHVDGFFWEETTPPTSRRPRSPDSPAHYTHVTPAPDVRKRTLPPRPVVQHPKIPNVPRDPCPVTPARRPAERRAPFAVADPRRAAHRTAPLVPAPVPAETRSKSTPIQHAPSIVSDAPRVPAMTRPPTPANASSSQAEGTSLRIRVPPIVTTPGSAQRKTGTKKPGDPALASAATSTSPVKSTTHPEPKLAPKPVQVAQSAPSPVTSSTSSGGSLQSNTKPLLVNAASCTDAPNASSTSDASTWTPHTNNTPIATKVAQDISCMDFICLTLILRYLSFSLGSAPALPEPCPHTSSIESTKGAPEIAPALQPPETVPEYALSKHPPATGTQTKPPPTSAGPIEVEPTPQASAHPPKAQPPKAQTQPVPRPAEEPMDIDHPAPIPATPLLQPNLNLDGRPAIPFVDLLARHRQLAAQRTQLQARRAALRTRAEEFAQKEHALEKERRSFGIVFSCLRGKLRRRRRRCVRWKLRIGGLRGQ
ncbi:hypothetical protein C0995_016494 [Termitomyces sp. Mi166|nr:hypothetical protein C0995_016494 [Termitomyces sp. Mi166\